MQPVEPNYIDMRGSRDPDKDKADAGGKMGLERMH